MKFGGVAQFVHCSTICTTNCAAMSIRSTGQRLNLRSRYTSDSHTHTYPGWVGAHCFPVTSQSLHMFLLFKRPKLVTNCNFFFNALQLWWYYLDSCFLFGKLEEIWMPWHWNTDLLLTKLPLQPLNSLLHTFLSKPKDLIVWLSLFGNDLMRNFVGVFFL